MAENQSIKRFIVRDPHGNVEHEDGFSVVGEVHVNIVPGYGEPYAESEYIDGTLTITIHNIEGNGITDITTDSQEGDEAVNTVTIKTNANPEGVTLEVRNGSRGNGIASSSEVLSPDDGGINTHTITDTDGNEHVFHTKNGSKGDKGDQGDSAVYDPDDPDTPDFIMANTTGQSTTKSMTQKAVTDAISDIHGIDEVIAFEQGGINTSGEDVDVDNVKQKRIRSEWIPSNKIFAIRITPSQSQKFYWYKFDSSKNFLGSGGEWIDSQTFLTLEKGKYYRFCVMSGDNGNISVSDLAVTFSFVYLNDVKNKMLQEIESSLGGIDICKVLPMRKVGISTGDELKINDVRISIVDHVKFHSGVKLLLKPNGQKMYWYEYDSSKSLVSTSGSWFTEEQYLSATDGHYYRFSFGKLDDSSFALSDVTVSIIVTSSAEGMKTENVKLYSLFEPACSSRYIFGKGSRWEYYMDTMEAYNAACHDQRCWAITGDVQYTSDGYYVMFHDRSLEFNGQTITINDLTYAQVQTIVLTQDGKNYSIPTLDQFLTICRKFGKLAILEIKAKLSALNWTNTGHEQDMINIIEKVRGYGMLDTLCVIAQPTDLQWLASHYPMVGKMRLANNDVSSGSNYDTYISPTLDDPQYIYLSYPKNTDYPNAMGADIITDIHNAGRKCIAYGPSPVPTGFIDDCINLGFDAVLVYDNPPVL